MKPIYALASILAITLTGCGLGPQRDPITEEAKSPTTTKSTVKAITVKNGMIFGNGQPPSEAIRFPEGTYKAESEDDIYIYYKSEQPIERRSFSTTGEITHHSFDKGGIMIAKNIWRTVPAGGYICERDGTKKLVWKLGSEFLSREGTKWKYEPES